MESDGQLLNIRNLVNNLKRKNKAYFRVVCDYFNNRWEQSLKGSTANLNKIFYDGYWEKNYPQLDELGDLTLSIDFVMSYARSKDVMPRFKPILEAEARDAHSKLGRIIEITHRTRGGEVYFTLYNKEGRSHSVTALEY